MAPQLFPTPFAFGYLEPLTLVELRMLYYSCTIRAKPSWWEKIHDPDIVAKWQVEMVEHDRVTHDNFWGGSRRFRDQDRKGHVKRWPRDPLTEAQIEYIFDELEYEAGERDPDTGIFTSGVRRACESHSLIDDALKAQLVESVAAFEHVPDDQKDWHPGSNGQVLDLVHPSLYPVCIGRTHVLKPNPSGGDPVFALLENHHYLKGRPDLEDEESYAVSNAYQWLPTDFAVTDDGESVTALGYINNVHPSRHRTLYPAITSIIARFIPMFERVLSDLASPSIIQNAITNYDDWYADLEVSEPEYDSDASDNDTYEERLGEWEHLHKWPRVPEPLPFEPPSTHLRVDYPLTGRTVQVIVKLANIHLTPENPRYPGGSWHVEGMANERIVATGLYYYAMENIKESRLAFRHCMSDGDNGSGYGYEENDHRGWSVVFGFGNNDGLNQLLGHVVAAEDKCVAFPNVYQHHVEPFELADKARAGHRKILALFLVDPNVHILSTSDVPPQQRDWAMNEAEKAPGLQSLPRELFDMVVGFAEDGLMSREEAEGHREKLMKERSVFVKNHNEETFEQTFNMCEH
ncbi:uncharacterized protein BXZ73DRAFT_99078 [Epithele typhae]|uniref:uncharacterized protein n=1 Tax=Epithele typhae TaxID=378194 RepID=UPI002008A68E|nr:uncharacterized protein BXZ73DRAFT_99078 [Epithele typhae]KAH9940076.1 hypothetical protein BXZ73DRAFT_99078 [Epithele typhae]